MTGSDPFAEFAADPMGFAARIDSTPETDEFDGPLPVLVPHFRDVMDRLAREAAEREAAHSGGPPTMAEQMTKPWFRQKVAERYDLSMINAAAASMAFAQGWHAPATYGSLAEELALPVDPVRWRITDLLAMNGNAVVVAPRKAGKTTMMGSLIKSLVDGDPFLGRYPVEPAGNVGLFNYEVPKDQQIAWLRDLGLANPDRVHVLHLRGASMPLNVPDVRRYVVQWLKDRKIKVWILDPYARAGQGVILNENDNAQASVFTGLLDEIKSEAGVTELIMPVHSSNKTDVESGRETARGAGRVEDWADALIYLTSVEGQRFVRAVGRDVELAETRLHFDQSTRSLTLGQPGQDRRKVGIERDASAVSKVLREWTGLTPATQNDLETDAELGSARRVKAAVAWLVERRLAHVTDGLNRAKYHHHGSKPQ